MTATASSSFTAPLEGVGQGVRAAHRKPRLATVWLGGCSGCHMSLLDLDERLFDLAAAADVVFSPVADVKEFPDEVDVTLVEGAATNEDHLRLIVTVRQRTRLLVALGDCAVTGNVTALRNLFGLDDVLRAAYVERATAQPQIPGAARHKGDTGGDDGTDNEGIVPRLLPRVEPLHRVVKVDAYLPGCPPSADRIWDAIAAALRGERPEPANRGPAPTFG